MAGQAQARGGGRHLAVLLGFLLARQGVVHCAGLFGWLPTGG
ncbi:hypothetical protein [Saccharopolyspora kobensis]|nr:hypothetical protein [Saccharopolyspora kobensis]